MGVRTVVARDILTGFGTVTGGILTGIAEDTFIQERTLMKDGSPTQDVTP